MTTMEEKDSVTNFHVTVVTLQLNKCTNLSSIIDVMNSLTQCFCDLSILIFQGRCNEVMPRQWCCTGCRRSVDMRKHTTTFGKQDWVVNCEKGFSFPRVPSWLTLESLLWPVSCDSRVLIFHIENTEIYHFQLTPQLIQVKIHLHST